MSETSRTKRTQKRIWVTDEITRQLVKDFEVTGNTVRIALKFYSDSDLSKKIRAAAIKKMEEVMVQNEQLMHEFDQA